MASLPGSEHTLHVLQDEIETVLKRIGIMHRVFGRVKSQDSLKRKIQIKQYDNDGRLLQDLVGIRVVVYFPEDCEIVRRAISKTFEVDSETIDLPGTEDFGPKRHNIVVRVKSRDWQIGSHDLPIDQTLEIQIRTVLSEGWHEVEHDLRYKCQNDWTETPLKLRTLNGALGALETAEWAMVSLFDGLAYHHYRGGNWESMLRHKFRMKIQDGAVLSDSIASVLTETPDVAKSIWRADRRRMLNRVAASRLSIPWTFDNLVHLICASESIKVGRIAELRPPYVADTIDRLMLPEGA